MRNFIYILTIIFSLNSCSEYQAVLKGDDVATKFKFATKLFESGKYTKANRIFVQIVPKYRGKPQAEKLMFMYFMRQEIISLQIIKWNDLSKHIPKVRKRKKSVF